jgi:hypothetical protein
VLGRVARGPAPALPGAAHLRAARARPGRPCPRRGRGQLRVLGGSGPEPPRRCCRCSLAACGDHAQSRRLRMARRSSTNVAFSSRRLDQLKTGWAPPGCTDPRKREQTVGNGMRVSRSGRRSPSDHAWCSYGSTPPSRTAPGEIFPGVSRPGHPNQGDPASTHLPTGLPARPSPPSVTAGRRQQATPKPPAVARCTVTPPPNGAASLRPSRVAVLTRHELQLLRREVLVGVDQLHGDTHPPGSDGHSGGSMPFGGSNSPASPSTPSSSWSRQAASSQRTEFGILVQICTQLPPSGRRGMLICIRLQIRSLPG